MSQPIMTQSGQWPDRVDQVKSTINQNREGQQPRPFGYWDSPPGQVNSSVE